MENFANKKIIFELEVTFEKIINTIYKMVERVPQSKESFSFENFKKSPAFTVIVNASLFVAGVVFIQSPLMDMLVPQL